MKSGDDPVVRVLSYCQNVTNTEFSRKDLFQCSLQTHALIYINLKALKAEAATHQPTFTCLKSTIETPRKTPERYY